MTSFSRSTESLQSHHTFWSNPVTRSNSTYSRSLTDGSEHDRAFTNHSSVEEAIAKPPCRIVLGTASIGSAQSPVAQINTAEEAAAYINIFRARGYFDIDTARAYPVGQEGTCETLLGGIAPPLSKWANISTKVSSFWPGCHQASHIEASINKSLDMLQAQAVDIMYLHAPDYNTDFNETCSAMDKAFRQGKFERFGLSNFKARDVKEVLDICERHGYIKPSVYQGQYNLLCRDAEEELLPLLRAQNIAFHAYSPSACGLFSSTITTAALRHPGRRWYTGSPLGAKYSHDYFQPKILAAAEIVRCAAEQFGMTGHAAALRWAVWHSELAAACGDGLIIGASNTTQLRQNLDYLEQGPLPEKLVKAISAVWQGVRGLKKRPKYSFL